MSSYTAVAILKAVYHYCLYLVFRAVFRRLGAIGRNGPTSIGCHYTGQHHEGQVTLSNGIQLWTVPYTGHYRIEAIGAGGGYGNESNKDSRGRGARMIGTFSLSKGETIRMLVGQAGRRRTHFESSGGGGGTFVVRRNNTPLIIAGGGGGIRALTESRPECNANTSTSGNTGYPLTSAGGENGRGAGTPNDDKAGDSISCSRFRLY